MQSLTTQEQQSQTTAVEWEPPMPPTDLIFDDGEPLESNRHRLAMNVLIRSMLTALADRNDYFAGGNMFIYYSAAQARNRDFRGPDFFVVLNVDGRTDRQGWVVWEENGRYPNVIVELMSPSTAAIDTGVKREIYSKTFRTPDYYVYDPFDPNSLQGWNLHSSQGYQSLVPSDRGWLWCEQLGLWLGTWEGTLERETAVWLRFYDQEGNLVLLPEELAQQQAENERLRANSAQQQAENERLRADSAEQQAESERLRADSAQQQLARAEQQLAIAQKQGALRQLLRLLTTRFGTASANVEQRLEAFTLNQLEDLVEVAMTVDSLEQFMNNLPENSL